MELDEHKRGFFVKLPQRETRMCRTIVSESGFDQRRAFGLMTTAPAGPSVALGQMSALRTCCCENDADF